jgi:hypothetical protein
MRDPFLYKFDLYSNSIFVYFTWICLKAIHFASYTLPMDICHWTFFWFRFTSMQLMFLFPRTWMSFIFGLSSRLGTTKLVGRGFQLDIIFGFAKLIEENERTPVNWVFFTKCLCYSHLLSMLRVLMHMAFLPQFGGVGGT